MTIRSVLIAGVLMSVLMGCALPHNSASGYSSLSDSDAELTEILREELQECMRGVGPPYVPISSSELKYLTGNNGFVLEYLDPMIIKSDMNEIFLPNGVYQRLGGRAAFYQGRYSVEGPFIKIDGRSLLIMRTSRGSDTLYAKGCGYQGPPEPIRIG